MAGIAEYLQWIFWPDKYVNQGRKAFINGISVDDCPYTGFKRYDWLFGWHLQGEKCKDTQSEQRKG